MRLKTTAAVTSLLVAAGLATPSMPAASAADRTKPPTSASSAPDSWTARNLPTFELYGQFKMPKTAKGEAYLAVTKWGYRFVAGAGNNKLTVTPTSNGLRFHDRAITRWTNLPGGCERVAVDHGRAVSCNLPDKHEDGAFLEIWPRLGNDTIDTSALGSKYRTWALTDAGKDDIRTGWGRDFINAAADRDVARGGGGDDWIRMGRNANRAYGGDGDDKLVGGENADRLHGGAGEDSVGGLAGDDHLWGDAGPDLLAGKVGRDTGYRDSGDTLRNIDIVRR